MKEDIFEIDYRQIDRQWKEQAQLYREASKGLPDIKEKLRRAEAQLKVVAAEIKQDIRKNPAKYGHEKTTEGIVEEVMLLQNKHRKAVIRTIRLRHDVEVMEVYLDALSVRKTALENAVILLCRDLAAEPKGPKGMSKDEVSETRKRIKPL